MFARGDCIYTQAISGGHRIKLVFAAFFVPCKWLIISSGKRLDLDLSTGGDLGKSNKFNAGAAGIRK